MPLFIKEVYFLLINLKFLIETNANKSYSLYHNYLVLVRGRLV